MLNNVKIAYIGGGSRAWARNLLSDLAGQDKFCGEVRLYDIDPAAAADNALIGNRLNDSAKAKSRWNYVCKDSLKQALTGADFVLISILPGTFDEMESDVHAPEAYHIYQAVGDTVGPGGMLRAMRTVPMFEKIALAIRDFAPDAWVINYTNPMSICVRTLYSVFPQIKAVGCCHEVFHTQYLLCKALEKYEGIKAHRRQLNTEVCGINHFTHFTSAFYEDYDLFKLYDRLVDDCYETGFSPDVPVDEYKRNCFLCSNRVKMDLYKRYGLIAAAGDRHLAEFCPGGWYLKDRETVDKWMFNLTPVSWRKNDLKERIRITREIVDGTRNFDIYDTDEEGVEIMAAILGLGDIVTNVNFPNLGQYLDAPRGSIVETNMRIGKDSVTVDKPITLPDSLNSLVMRVMYNQQTIVEASLKRDLKLAFCAFASDPLCAPLSLSDARTLFDTMVQNTKNYLTDWNL